MQSSKPSLTRLLKKTALYAMLGLLPISACNYQAEAPSASSAPEREAQTLSAPEGKMADSTSVEAPSAPVSIAVPRENAPRPQAHPDPAMPLARPGPAPSRHTGKKMRRTSRGGVAQGRIGGAAGGTAGAPKGGLYAGSLDDLGDDGTRTGDFEGREEQKVNAPTQAAHEATSTFAVDVDTAAYSIARRSLQANRMPTPSLVRVEELVNYFRYDYDPPSSDPFSIQIDGARSPVDATKHMLRVGVQAQIVEDQDRLPSNLVFLLDTSCSMTSGDKLELAKKSFDVALEQLGPKDKVAITTYAGGVGVILPPTPVTDANRPKIRRAMHELRTSGGTAMASGLSLAYQQAARMLAPNTNTRIIVASDGDANIGATSPDAILKEIKGYVSEGVRLSTIGYGDGNYKDEMMERLANSGNGNYYYIDSERMAQRVFGRDLTKMLQDVAQDVKIQVEFNPKNVNSWRLVGYENRHIDNKDFRNDKVDAGEIGAGHQVTALYELALNDGADGELATVRVRSKTPRGVHATESERTIDVRRVAQAFERAPEGLRFATAVMGGAELLRNSPFAEAWTYDRVINLISDSASKDPDRAEFLALMKKARQLGGSGGARLSFN